MIGTPERAHCSIDVPLFLLPGPEVMIRNGTHLTSGSNFIFTLVSHHETAYTRFDKQ